MQSGDATPLDNLVDEHLPSALRFATRLSGDPGAAEDIVQEALLRATRHWSTFRGKAPFRTWLFRIIINVFRDRVAQASVPASLPSDVVDPQGVDPAAGVLLAELGQFMAARVSALPPRQREVLVLVTYEGLSHREAAGVLEISEESVYSNLHLARQRLRRELAPYLVEQRDD